MTEDANGERLDFSGLPARVRSLIGDRSLRSFARQVGIKEATLRGILKGGRPYLDTIAAIARGAGVDFNWLATGEGSPEGPSQAGMVLVPVLSARFADAPEVVEMLPVSEALLRWLRVSPADARLVEAPGPSWEPLARHGDVLLADASQRDPALGGLFLVRAGNFLSLQRVKIDPHGEAHTVEPGGHKLTPAELKALGKTVVGRVLWIMRRAG